jgi:hypothetical protein
MGSTRIFMAIGCDRPSPDKQFSRAWPVLETADRVFFPDFSSG